MEAPVAYKNAASGNPQLEMWKKRSGRVRALAECLGSRSSTEKPEVGGEASLKSFFDSSVADSEVVLTLPSLDLGIIDGSDGSAPLPVIGETNDRSGAVTVTSTNASSERRPVMAASVLTGATETAADSEEKAARNIEKLTSWTKSTLEYASDAAKKNISKSFISLVQSRVRAWTLLLLRHSLSTGDNESRTRLMRMLGSSVKVESIETIFKTLELPEKAAAQAKEATVVLPLIFESVLHISSQLNEKTTLRAPGTMTGSSRCIV